MSEQWCFAIGGFIVGFLAAAAIIIIQESINHERRLEDE